eukprot:scaffold511915_cov32-Prasinocladus_malaysianus.AAC.1
MQLTWLFLMDGNTDGATALGELVVRLMVAWHGPGSPVATAAQLMLAEARGELDDELSLSDPTVDDEPPSPMVTTLPGGVLSQSRSFES